MKKIKRLLVVAALALIVGATAKVQTAGCSDRCKAD